MKQNSSILFHPMPNVLKNRKLRAVCAAILIFAVENPHFALAATPPSSLSAQGFKPAQRDLVAIFLQIATSLEQSGTPEPYLRHIKNEHTRIEALYQQKFGRSPKSFCPAYITNAYINQFAANWNALAPKLDLTTLAREIGKLMKDALSGGADASAVALLNRHQANVFGSIAGNSKSGATFDDLQTSVTAALTAPGEVSGKAGKTIAVASAAQQRLNALYTRLDRTLPEKDAKQLKAAISGIFVIVGSMAQSELEAGIAEWAITEKAASSYDVAGEAALSADERNELAALLKKPRFSKADFASLERFYAAAYHRVSEQGRDELSRRVWAGTEKK